MDLLVDMNLSPVTVNYLNSIGHNAVHARDLGLKRAKDKELLKVAASLGRVVITQDLDFGELIFFSDESPRQAR
ncbi:MAG: DUF5615 family PIN-like protein [Actinomycetota bacterium]|nr:DUF5615 family PIN-like protein [Actinomycetota bacterium]